MIVCTCIKLYIVLVISNMTRNHRKTLHDHTFLFGKYRKFQSGLIIADLHALNFRSTIIDSISYRVRMILMKYV